MDKTQVKLIKDLVSPMRDGTRLYADLYRPDDNNKYPVILMRTPYGKLNSENDKDYSNPFELASHGYNVLIQDCRGTGISGGVLAANGVNEIDDGYDTVEWAAAQAWSDGNIGMIGLSYFGYTQLAAASTNPPHLKAICPFQAPGIRPFGVSPSMTLGIFHLAWLYGQAIPKLDYRTDITEEQKQSIKANLEENRKNMDKHLLYLPLRENPAAYVGGVPQLLDYINLLDGLEDQEFWKKTKRPLDFTKMIVPMLHLSGWYDGALEYTIENYITALSNAPSPSKGQRLVIGPWTHGGTLPQKIDDVDFGEKSSGKAFGVAELSTKWYDYWLKGIDNGILDTPPVSIFVMGENKWRDEWEWPLARTKYTDLYLHSKGSANSIKGNGTLDISVPGNEPSDRFTYDPGNPVPLSMMGTINGHVIENQAPLEERDDILVYTGATLTEEIEVTGPVRLKLYASTSAQDTDFTCKLVDVHPDGYVQRLTSGIVRARFRNGMKAEFLEPGKIYKYIIEVGHISNVFLKGHKIRIEVSSSSYPEDDRNLNTTDKIGSGGNYIIAEQTIHHNEGLPSKLILPVIPR